MRLLFLKRLWAGKFVLKARNLSIWQRNRVSGIDLEPSQSPTDTLWSFNSIKESKNPTHLCYYIFFLHFTVGNGQKYGEEVTCKSGSWPEQTRDGSYVIEICIVCHCSTPRVAP